MGKDTLQTTLGYLVLPTVEPVSRDEMKAWLRVDDTDSDGLIDGLIVAARWHAEQYTRRQCTSATLRLLLNEFPADYIELPICPVQSVSSIAYDDTDGNPQTLSTALYRVTDAKSEPVRIERVVNQTWPATRGHMQAVRVDFVAGYGATAAAVPGTLKTYIKMLAANWFENREAVNPATLVPVPLAVESLQAGLSWGDYVNG